MSLEDRLAPPGVVLTPSGTLAAVTSALNQLQQTHFAMTDEIRRLKLAHATLYNLLYRFQSADMAPTAEEIVAVLRAHDGPTSLVDLIVVAYQTLTPNVQAGCAKRMRVARLKDPK